MEFHKDTPIIFNEIEDNFHLGIKTIIIQNNKILVLKVEKGNKNYWDLPGGRVLINENVENTAFREIEEETGIKLLANFQHLGMILSDIRITLKNGNNVGLIFSFYKANVKDDETVTLSDEHKDYEWVTIQKATQFLEMSYGKKIIDMLLQI